MEPVGDHEDFITGWCLLNLTGTVAKSTPDGFQGTLFTKIKASYMYGVQLFLNICASYLKAKKDNGGEGRQSNNFVYEEPFGSFTDCKGTEGFPWFDFQCPCIVCQQTTFDCGLAVVANSMAFVNHLKKVKFMKSNMTRQNSNEFCFLLNDKIYSLKHFWDIVMRDAGTRRHFAFSTSILLLKFMRKEYLEIIDEIAEKSVTDAPLFDQLNNEYQVLLMKLRP
jgi:hypothetical protein